MQKNPIIPRSILPTERDQITYLLFPHKTQLLITNQAKDCISTHKTHPSEAETTMIGG
jgi:hypothetical protein